MSLTVLTVAFPFAPVGRSAVGGAEIVASLIDEGLVRQGLRSIVVACEGSTAHGTLVPTVELKSSLDDRARRAGWAAHRAAIEEVLATRTVDLVHFHGLDFEQYLPSVLEVPALATLHLPPAWHSPSVFSLPERGVDLVCVSASQRRECPWHLQQHLEVMPNGVPLDDLRGASRRGGYFLMLGRICHEKGFHLALEAAHRRDAPLLIAGQTFPYPEHLRYFVERITPHLDDRRRFVGPVGMRGKRRLLARARALLVPSLVAETSSLVAMEAMACGTPVIAYRAGALPEVVEHGRTGFIVDDVEGLVQAMGRLHEIDPAECRRVAEERFSSKAMVGRYVDLYRRLCARRVSRAPEPERRPNGGGPITLRAHAGGGGPVPVSSPMIATTPNHGAHPGAATARLRAEYIRDAEELARLRPEWLALWKRAPLALPFNHPDWLISWCRHFDRREVEAFALFRGARLVALAPMEVWREGSVRVLKLLGAGVSDAADVLVDVSEAHVALPLLVEEWRRRADLWDVCDLMPLRADAAALSMDVSGAVISRCDVSPELALGQGRPLEEIVPAGFAARVRYAQRRFDREGGNFEDPPTPAEAAEWIGELASLHAQQWRRRAQPGVLEDSRVVAFHRDVARAFAEEKLLRMEALRFDDRRVGVLYAFAAQRRCFYYLSGFDPELDRFSPGTLLIAAAIERASGRGDRWFDFLRGAEPYKYQWGATDRPLYRRVVGSERGAGTSRQRDD